MLFRLFRNRTCSALPLNMSVQYQSEWHTKNHLRTINMSLVKDECAREPERLITHQTLLGKFRSLILSFKAVDTASDSTLLYQRLMSSL